MCNVANVSLTCRAPINCDYSCAAGTPSDVTQVAVWSVDDPSVARIAAPGVVVPVASGNTVLRVSWTVPSGFTTAYFIPIAVFPGSAPLETYEYEGLIYDGGAPARTPLNGALVEVLDGLVAGRRTVSGAIPDFYPGATLPPAVAGHYAFFGIPSGTYRLRVSKAGFVTQEVTTGQLTTVVLLPAQ